MSGTNEKLIALKSGMYTTGLRHKQFGKIEKINVAFDLVKIRKSRKLV